MIEQNSVLPSGANESEQLEQLLNGNFDTDRLPGVLDDVEQWLTRFVTTTTPEDIQLLVLWAAHTHVIDEMATTPRLWVNSVMPGSGKTTVLEHLSHLSYKPMMASEISSGSFIARLIDQGMRTILIDEADRSLDERDENKRPLIAILNSGYKKSGRYAVLVQESKGKGKEATKNWVAKEMKTFSPLAFAGNNPRLADDTEQRCIRVQLMPDLDNRAEPTEWEFMEEEADELRQRLAAALEVVRPLIRYLRKPPLPDGMGGRIAEKWRPLARVASVAGGRWPEIAMTLMNREMKEIQLAKDAEMQTYPDRVQLLKDLAEIWPADQDYIPTEYLLQWLANRFPERWGIQNESRGVLKAQGLGRMLSKNYGIYADRPTTGEQRKRGYRRAAFILLWDKFRFPYDSLREPANPDEPDEPATLGF